MNHTKELIERAHKGDKEARDTLVMENMGLVYSVARRYLGRGYELEDLSQLGVIGLIKAIDKFDCDYCVMLSTYDVPMISGEIKRFLRDDGMVKVSRTLKENAWKISKACEMLSQKYGRDATVDEIAAATELSKEDIVMAMDANKDVESIYKSVYENDGSEIYLVDQISSKENEKEKLLDRLMLEKLMEELNEEEKRIINMRYFENKTQTQVAKILSISQVQVSRMEKKILLKMRKNIQ